ncbi:hypothetical protein HY641_04820 [Candidatus Woesearchaeota archaeon]|nr:hypothetical protein [Candidatus Woesearchaeota archaeon]
MANFIEQIQKINALSQELLRQGKARDATEASKMAEQMIAGDDLADFNKNAETTVKHFQAYGDAVKSNDMRQPRDWKHPDKDKPKDSNEQRNCC